MKRIGIMGGTFDPIHLGHLIIASFAADELDLDRVLFMPAQTPPHKRGNVVTDTHHRIAMVQAAIAPDPRFAFSDMDMLDGRPSYTVDLLARLHEIMPDDELSFIIGADSLRDFPKWYEPERILSLAGLAVARRPGTLIEERMLNALPGLRSRVVVFDSPLIDISSTNVRTRHAAGRSIAWLVPPGVERYITDHGLYRRHETAASGRMANPTSKDGV